MRGRSTPARRFAAAAFAALVGSVVLGTGVAEAAPSITVDPSGTLAAKATVKVTARGFGPFTTVVVAQCKPDGTGVITGPAACADARTGSSAVVVADAQGAVKATLTITVGDIRSGVSCSADACAIAAISTVSTTIQTVAPITLTGSGTSLPAASATPTASASTAPRTPTPSASASDPASATPAPSTSEPVATPEPSSPPAGNAGRPPKALPRTGPDDASRSLVLGLVVLQVGLVVWARGRRARPGAGRHTG